MRNGRLVTRAIGLLIRAAFVCALAALAIHFITVGYPTSVWVAAIATALLLLFRLLSELTRLYGFSRDWSLFARRLQLSLTPTWTPKRQVEKEMALKRHHGEVDIHCKRKNVELIEQGAMTLNPLVHRAWKRWASYGDLEISRHKDIVYVTAANVGPLFDIQVLGCFPVQTVPYFNLQHEGATICTGNTKALAKALQAVITRRLRDHERLMQRGTVPPGH